MNHLGIQFQIDFSRIVGKNWVLSTIKMFARRIQPFGNIILYSAYQRPTTNPIQIPFNSISNNSFFSYRFFSPLLA